MHLRRAEPADGDAVAELFVAARRTMTYLPPLDVEGASAFIRERVVGELETWVAEDDRGAILGFATVNEGDLDHLYVAPAAQGRGVGASLLEHVKSLRPDGFEFWVFQRNEGARRFYERHGCTLLRLTDGAQNMEREPDARYAWSS
ncbi:MAG: hypothetical protein QOH73_404 [Gaiellaceae bacterium]|nr:hypothetical protein [Gaiellaceae bacterium]